MHQKTCHSWPQGLTHMVRVCWYYRKVLADSTTLTCCKKTSCGRGITWPQTVSAWIQHVRNVSKLGRISCLFFGHFLVGFHYFWPFREVMVQLYHFWPFCPCSGASFNNFLPLWPFFWGARLLFLGLLATSGWGVCAFLSFSIILTSAA